jgi:alpha-tubulin suppressor-like RCC1 family protein
MASGAARCWGNSEYGQLGHSGRPSRFFDSPVPVSGLTDVAQITAGCFHTCALLGDETLSCWGRNHEGQLGDATMTDRRAPVPVSGLTGVMAVSAGGLHTCAHVAGIATCWGYNGQGQIGDGTTGNQSSPVVVTGLTGVEAVETGGGDGLGHTCARLSDGTARCWGRNASGELGDGTTTQRTTPVPVVWDVSP